MFRKGQLKDEEKVNDLARHLQVADRLDNKQKTDRKRRPRPLEKVFLKITAQGQSYQRVTYYFCCEDCRAAFKKDPTQYAP